MHKYFNKFIYKVLALSILIVIIFNIGDNLINANPSNKKIVSKNNYTFTNIKEKSNSALGKTGVAITTNLGMRYKQKKELPVTIYKNIFSINELMATETKVNEELVGKNMIIIEEYRNILKTNVIELVNSNYDRPRILEAFIDQLEYRYILSSDNVKNLNKQKTIFGGVMNSSNSKIELLKQKISRDFKSNDSEESLDNIETYLELKKEYYYARTYIIYINHFLYEYNYLNNYNKRLLDTLINNKQAIIKDAFIVIPDTGTELLRNFNLIYDEKDFKGK